MAIISFKGRARRHQIKYREEVLNVEGGAYETHLSEKDAMQVNLASLFTN